MNRRAAIIISVVFPSTWAVLMYPCSEPPQPEREQYIAGAWLHWNWNETGQPSSLPEQLLRNPCLEFEYYGYDIKRSMAYSIYGTCNYREMFRYTARVQVPYGCWRTELYYRSDPGGPCERDYVNLTVSFMLHNKTMMLYLNPEQDHIFYLMHTPMYHHMLTAMRLEASRSPGQDRKQYNDFRVQQCRCNSTGRPRQSEFWKHRRCVRSSEKLEQIQASTANGFVGWLGLALVMLGAIGTIGAIVFSRV